MTDRPIIFSGAMVRALLDGRKTQTRRLIATTKKDLAPGQILVFEGPRFGGTVYRFEPRFEVGDRLYVREAFSYAEHLAETVWYSADGNVAAFDCSKPKPSIHMPRWASRLTLLVDEVRIERLQAISIADAIAEGTSCYICGLGPVDGTSENDCGCFHSRDLAVPSYRVLWDSLHGDGAWDANPWVVALTFRVIRQNIDQIEFPEGAGRDQQALPVLTR